MNKKQSVVLTVCLMIFLTACGQSKNKSESGKTDRILKTGWYSVSEQETKYKRQLDKTQEVYFINPEVIIPVEQFDEMEITENEYNGAKYVSLVIRFDKKGEENWSIATKKAIGSRVAFIMNDKLLYAPKVNAQIPSGVSSVSRSDYTKQDLEELARQIRLENRSVTISPDPNAISLPQPQKDGSISVEKSLNNRRSHRQFQDQEISIAHLSQILWAAYGVTLPVANAPFLRGGLRTAPSAGGLYPLELYVVVGKVEGIEPGLYKYLSKEHKILKVIDKDIRADLCSAALGQRMLQDAPVSIVYTAIFSRTTDKYKERGRERYVWIDLGHSAENVYLQAEALGLGTCAVGAFSDEKMVDVLKLPKEEEPLYIMPVGHCKE